MANYTDEDDLDALADYEAEMAQQDEAAEFRGEFETARQPRVEYRSDERFTTYDQHGFLDSEWSR